MNREIRKKAAIWLALVFILGTATGGVFGYSLARRSYAATKIVAPSEAEHRAKKVADMTDAIGLTAEHAQKAEGITRNAQSAYRTIRDKKGAEVDGFSIKTRASMRPFLRPEHLPKL